MNNISYEYLLDIDKIKNVYHKIRVNTKNKNKLFSFEMFYLCNIYSILNVLKCDIKKYFYNIDHNLLLNKLKTIINDENIFLIIENIIKSTDQEYINLCVRECIHEEIKRVNDSSILDKEKRVKELESIPLYKEGFGLPIGNMTSQILAIYFLNEIDHYIKEQLHSKYYIRYMDDLVIIDYDKERLKRIKGILEEKIKNFNLEFNHKTNIYDLKYAFSFLGYRFVLNKKRLVIKINGNTKKELKEKRKK